ncbi:MAG: carboxypeptidase-like regulatory domain-containing protein [Bacteroidota bacterium]|nr:carboxypeptidase-like regulatory domain-containing protein [Bacteroidota bacterium]
MRHSGLHASLFVLSLTLITSAHGQDKRISGDFQGIPFSQLVSKMAAASGYTFYYDPAETDSLVIHVTVEHATLPELLDLVFRGTDLHYAIDPAGRVFISKLFVIQTQLPAEATRQDGPPISIPGDPTQKQEEDPSSKHILKAIEENKLIEIGRKDGKALQGKATLAGYIRDAKTGEAIVGASVYADSSTRVVITDQFGYYSLTLPRGRHVIRISSQGMKDTRRQVLVYGDGKLSVDMQEFIASLKTVIVSAEKTSNTRSTQMGVNRLNIKTIKQVPVVFGETDILKVVLTLPGVTSVGEASNGFNVRGGSTDQNLILFDEATIYNPSHLFGFFSAFNADVVKGIELYKSAIPEKYGGRLSSVLDVSMLDGNSKKWTGSGGIGPLTSRFFIEGPLVKDKTSMVASVRTTYSDWVLRTIPNNAYSNSTTGFSDANLRITHMIDQKNSIYVMGYFSTDHFNLNTDSVYHYSNQNGNIKWKHIFSNKSNALITAGMDRYQYSVSDPRSGTSAYKLGFDINQTYLRADFNYLPGNKHIFNYGVNSIYYKLHPGSYEPVGAKSLVVPNTVAAEQALESAIYAGDQYSVSQKLAINAGVRWSVFNYLGTHQEYEYAPGFPKQTTTITDSIFYGSGKVIKTYAAPEIRISARYQLGKDASVKASFNTTRQYIHMLSNTVAVSPTDIWKLSDPHIKPQQGLQYSLGYYRNFSANTIETSVEVYYKQIGDYLDYKSGASLVLNHHIETDVLTTKGKAYGVELLVKKASGRLNGWFSYAFSRTFLKQDDPLAGESINNGKYYPASFDKPHNVNFIGNYRFSHRYSVSLNIVYSTGRPITLPLSVFQLGGTTGLFYSERNQYRIPDYFRTDLSVNIDGNHRIKKLTHNFWSAGVYNLTGRQNPYSVYFTQENGQVKGYKLSIFGAPIPFITYNIKF